MNKEIHVILKCIAVRNNDRDAFQRFKYLTMWNVQLWKQLIFILVLSNANLFLFVMLLTSLSLVNLCYFVSYPSYQKTKVSFILSVCNYTEICDIYLGRNSFNSQRLWFVCSLYYDVFCLPCAFMLDCSVQTSKSIRIKIARNKRKERETSTIPESSSHIQSHWCWGWRHTGWW